MSLPPVAQRAQDGPQVAALVGQHVFGARRMILVEPALDDARIFQRLEAGRKSIRAYSRQRG